MKYLLSHSRLGTILKVIRGALFPVLAIASFTAAHAEFPDHPIRLIVGSPPGAMGDILARQLGQKLGEALLQPVIIENRPGAALAIAASAVAKSPADGYTLFFTPDSSLVANQFVYKKLTYEPEKDFRSIGMVGRASLVLVASPSLNVKTLDEYVKKVKAMPGRLNFGSAGVGHASQLIMEVINDRLGLQMTHVPYKGSTDAIQGVATGDVAATVVGSIEALPFAAAGRVVPLAVAGPLAKEIFPGLPVLRDVNPELDLTVWFGLVAPRATPDAVVTRLNAELNKVLQQQSLRQTYAELGFVTAPASTDSLDRIIRADRERFGPLIKRLGITAE